MRLHGWAGKQDDVSGRVMKLCLDAGHHPQRRQLSGSSAAAGLPFGHATSAKLSRTERARCQQGLRQVSHAQCWQPARLRDAEPMLAGAERTLTPGTSPQIRAGRLMQTLQAPIMHPSCAAHTPAPLQGHLCLCLCRSRTRCAKNGPPHTWQLDMHRTTASALWPSPDTRSPQQHQQHASAA